MEICNLDLTLCGFLWGIGIFGFINSIILTVLYLELDDKLKKHESKENIKY